MPRTHNRGRDGTRKSEYRQIVSLLKKEIQGLKRKLKNCVCPHCGFGFKQKYSYKPRENKDINSLGVTNE